MNFPSQYSHPHDYNVKLGFDITTTPKGYPGMTSISYEPKYGLGYEV